LTDLVAVKPDFRLF